MPFISPLGEVGVFWQILDKKFHKKEEGAAPNYKIVGVSHPRQFMMKLRNRFTAIVAAAAIAISGVGLQSAPAFAVTNTVNSEVINQTRAIAAAIQTRIQVYWSLWVDRQVRYVEDMANNPAPTWPTAAEVNAAIGGHEISGLTFSEVDMPVGRNNSFILSVAVDSEMGGAASASYIRTYLPMAQINANVISVPVLRPSFALGLTDLTKEFVQRDGTNPEGLSTFGEDVDVTFGKDGAIIFDPETGGDIENVRNITGDDLQLDADQVTATGDLTVNGTLRADNAHITNELTAGSIEAETGQINGDFGVDGDLILGSDSSIRGDGSITITGTSGSTLSQLIINALETNINGGLTVDSDLTVNGTIRGSSEHAENADHASNADYADSAGTANNANYADSAGHANSADYASNAGSADTASTAISFGDESLKIYTANGNEINFGGTGRDTTIYVGVTGMDGRSVPVKYVFGGKNGNAEIVATTVTADNFVGNATTATALQTARTIGISGGADGTPTAFDGTSDIVIPITNLAAAYLTGEATIDTTGNAGSATKLQNSVTINGVEFDGTKNIVVKDDTKVAKAGDTMTGLLTAQKGIQLDRSNDDQTGISFFSQASAAWQNYMAAPDAGQGILGNLRAPSGSIVNQLALRSLVEDQKGYGWTWESVASGSTNPSIVAELESDTGNFVTVGTITSPSFIGNLVGTADRATQADRANSADSSDYASMVAGYYGGSSEPVTPSFVPSNRVRFAMANVMPGATFDTSAFRDVMIMDTYTGTDVPVVTAFAIDKNLQTKGAYLLWGTKGSSTWDSVQRILTSENIGGYTAGAADKLAVGRTIAISGAVVGNPTLFDGTQDISIYVTGVDVSKLQVMTPGEYLPTTGLYSDGIYDLISKYAVTLQPTADGSAHDLYVTNAVYAENAGSADYASNSGKLGGYDASEYLRKDELEYATASYQEVEWTTPGTYSWVVPDGVNSILVTTVGGGGGVGFNYFASTSGSKPYTMVFTGGQGGEVTPQMIVNVTPGETLTIVVGEGGSNGLQQGKYISGTWYQNAWDMSIAKKYAGTSGGDGGDSYIAKNGEKISTTLARGGEGGYGTLIYGHSYNAGSGTYIPGYWAYGGGQYTGTTRNGGGKGGYMFIYRSYGTVYSRHQAESGYSGVGGTFLEDSASASYYCVPINAYYEHTGGGGSWGDGGDPQNNSDPGTGGGGATSDDIRRCADAHSAGSGMVRILAIGLTYDE